MQEINTRVIISLAIMARMVFIPCLRFRVTLAITCFLIDGDECGITRTIIDRNLFLDPICPMAFFIDMDLERHIAPFIQYHTIESLIVECIVGHCFILSLFPGSDHSQPSNKTYSTTTSENHQSLAVKSTHNQTTWIEVMSWVSLPGSWRVSSMTPTLLAQLDYLSVKRGLDTLSV